MSTITLPQSFLDRMSNELQDEYTAFLSSFNQSRINGLRVNPLKTSAEGFLKRWPWDLKPIPWAKDGFTYDYRTHPGQHPYHSAGVYYLQEPSAMAVLHYLDPQPGERILDLAAAPGGKSTAIASRLNRQGLLWANEIHPGRARILAQNLERWGASNFILSNENPEKLAKHLPQYFDRVLLDAPCSGEGMFRKDPEAIKEWSPEHVLACATRQSLILESAAALLKPGGRLVYSTCTFSREENEVTILCFLEQHPEFHPIPVTDPSPGFVHPPSLPEAVRLYPHRLQGEGHFIVALEKTATPPLNYLESKRPQTKKSKNPKGQKNSSRDSKNDLSSFEAFREATLLPSTAIYRDSQLQERLVSFGDHLYLSPEPTIPLAGLIILRPGLHLGERKPGRFQPGQALAFALNPDSVKQYFSLSPSEPRCLSYLRGESIPSEGPDGWVLVGVDEFPLGWAKRVQGELKNHYPKELRAK